MQQLPGCNKRGTYHPVPITWFHRGNTSPHIPSATQQLPGCSKRGTYHQVLSHYTSWERQPAAVQELLNNKPYKSPKQSHAEDHIEQFEATSGEDHRRRSGRLQSRKKYHRADLHPTHSMWEISPAPGRHLPCLHRLQEGLRQGLACSFVGNHEEVQHQHQPYPSHQKPL